MNEILSLQRLAFADADLAIGSTHSNDCSMMSLIVCDDDDLPRP